MTEAVTEHRDLPKRIGSYRTVGWLGGGGMGSVFLGETRDGRRVAIKVIRSEFAEDPSFRARFKREVEAASRVSGRYTAAVLDAAPEAVRPYVVTEFIEGPSLEAHVRSNGPLQEEQSFVLSVALAEALAAVHRAGIVHRDLKPSNILLAVDGPRLIDFGIARAADATSLTQTGAAIGTPSWMSPEQARGQQAGPLADIFCWGAVVAYAATGRPPFGEGSPDAVLYRVVHEEPDLEGLPDRLRPAVERCLEKAASPRPDALELIRNLIGDETLSDSALEASRRTQEIVDATWHITSHGRALPTGVRRRRRLTAMVGGFVAIAVAVAAGSLALVRSFGEPRPGEQRSESPRADQAQAPLSPRRVPLSSLLRPGTQSERVLFADLDGLAPREIVVLASSEAGRGSIYLDVFSRVAGSWRRLADLSRSNREGADQPVIPGESGFAAPWEVPYLELTDLNSDGVQELFVGVKGPGGNQPLRLWVLSKDGENILAEVSMATGGVADDVQVRRDEIIVAAEHFSPSDLPCCPSYGETLVIGADGESIDLVSESITPVSASSPDAAADRLNRAWAADDREAALSIAEEGVVDTMFEEPLDLRRGFVYECGGPPSSECSLYEPEGAANWFLDIVGDSASGYRVANAWLTVL